MTTFSKWTSIGFTVLALAATQARASDAAQDRADALRGIHGAHAAAATAGGGAGAKSSPAAREACAMDCCGRQAGRAPAAGASDSAAAPTDRG